MVLFAYRVIYVRCIVYAVSPIGNGGVSALGGGASTWSVLILGWAFVTLALLGFAWTGRHLVCLCRGLSCNNNNNCYNNGAYVAGSSVNLTPGCGNRGCGQLDCGSCRVPDFVCHCRWVWDWFVVLFIASSFFLLHVLNYLVRYCIGVESYHPTIVYVDAILLGTVIFYIAFSFARRINLWWNLLLASFVTILFLHIRMMPLNFAVSSWISAFFEFLVLWAITSLFALMFPWRLRCGGWVAGCGTDICPSAVKTVKSC